MSPGAFQPLGKDDAGDQAEATSEDGFITIYEKRGGPAVLLNTLQARALQRFLDGEFGQIPQAIKLPLHASCPTLDIVYKNWKGNVARRHINPHQLWFGVNEWHPDPQWFLDAMDLKKSAMRSFAMRDIQSVEEATHGS